MGHLFEYTVHTHQSGTDPGWLMSSVFTELERSPQLGIHMCACVFLLCFCLVANKRTHNYQTVYVYAIITCWCRPNKLCIRYYVCMYKVRYIKHLTNKFGECRFRDVGENRVRKKKRV